MLRKVFLIFCILLFGVETIVSWSDSDNEAYIIELRYPKSYDARTYQLGPEVRNVTYKVRLSFPSKDVVHFYDPKLKGRGWIPFTQPNYPPESDRTWDQFIDGSVKGNPLVHQLSAEWVNKEKNKMIVLGLRYISIYPNKPERMYASERYPNNNIQEVWLQIRPFSILPPPRFGK